MDVLCALVRARQPSVVIETGTFEGRTTLALAQAMFSYREVHDALLLTVEVDAVRADLATQRLGAAQGSVAHWQVQVGDALAALQSFAGRADFVFLDDDHSPEHVDAEIAAAKAILAPGGIICVHDVLGPFGLDRVVRAHGGVVLDFPRLHVAGGLGIVAP